MKLSEKLSPFKVRYYQSLEADFTTRKGFQHSPELNTPTSAPDWNPSPKIDCGEGLHVVSGHPLLTHKFVRRSNPIYFEVKTIPDPPVPSADNDGKFRAQTVIKIRPITNDSPEFNAQVLAKIAFEDEDEDVRQAVVNKLDSAENAQVLAKIAVEDKDWRVRQAAINKLDPAENAQVLAKIAVEDKDWRVRQAVVNKLDPAENAQVLAKIAVEDEDEDVRQAAVNKLDSAENAQVLAKIAVEDKDWRVRQAAEQKLAKG